MKTITRIVAMTTVLSGATAGVMGCSSSTHSEANQPTVVEYHVRDVPGAVEYVWEEPMVDVIDVPPGLDPEGHYYRPAHQEVSEIRQGRWQYYKRPNR